MRFIKIISYLFLFCLAGSASGQTFSFSCLCGQIQGDTCDICPNTNVKSRSFSGLLIYRNGIPYKWIDRPYTVRWLGGQSLQFMEQIPTPDQITINRFQTSYPTLADFIAATNCNCDGGDGPTYVAGPGIVINGDTISLADTLPACNVAFGIGDGVLYLQDACGELSVPILSIAPVQGVVQGTGINVSSLGGIYTVSNTGDLLTNNEGVLGVDPGISTTSIIRSNTSGATGIIMAVSTGLSISEITSSNGGTITFTNTAPDQVVSLSGAGISVVTGTYPNFTVTSTEVDGSILNEIQTITNSNTTNLFTSTLSNSGGVFNIQGAGINVVTRSGNTAIITGTEIDGSVVNEGIFGIGAGGVNSATLITNTSTGNVITINVSTGLSISEVTSANGGSITLTNTSPDQIVGITGAGISVVTGTYPNFTVTSTEIDGSVTNEIQTLSYAAPMLSLTGGGTVNLYAPGDTNSQVLISPLPTGFNSSGNLSTRNLENTDLPSKNKYKVGLSGTVAAFGDSFTVGQGATPVNFSYINQLAILNGYTFNNQGQSGKGASVAAIAAYSVQPTFGGTNAATIFVGFNDVRRNGSANSTLFKIVGCQRSIIVNTFLRFGIAASGVTNTGTWSNYTGIAGKAVNLSGNMRQSSTIGNSLTYVTTTQTDNVVIGTVNCDGTTYNYGRFSVTIDSIVQDTFNPSGRTDLVSDGVTDNGVTPEVLIYKNLKNSVHTVKITLLDAKATIVDYIGYMNYPQNCPPVIVVSPGRMDATGYATSPASATNAVMTALKLRLKSLCDEFSSRPLAFVDLDQYYDITKGLSADHIHPNNAGHSMIANAIQSAIRTTLSGSVSSVGVSGGTTGLTTTGGPITSTGTITLTGTLLPIAGGTGTNIAFTPGSIIFAGSSGVYSQDNTNLFYNFSNKWMGIGTNTPFGPLHVVGSTNAYGLEFQAGQTGIGSAVFSYNRALSAWGGLSIRSAELTMDNVNTGATFEILNSGNIRLTGANVMIGTSTATRKLDVDGTFRVRSTSGITATGVAGLSADGSMARFILGGGLSISGDTLKSSVGSGATNLTITGTSSPLLLNSSTGTDVNLTAGAGISLLGSTSNVTIINTGDTNAADDHTGTGTANQVVIWSGSLGQYGSSQLNWDNSNYRLGIGTATPAAPLVVVAGANAYGIELVPGYLTGGSTIFSYSRLLSQWGDFEFDAAGIKFQNQNTSQYFEVLPAGGFKFSGGVVNVSNLAGSGVRLVTASATGDLATTTPAGLGLGPAGANYQLQYYDTGVFGAESDLNYAPSTNRLGIGINVAAANLNVRGTSTSTGLNFLAENSAGNDVVKIGNAGWMQFGDNEQYPLFRQVSVAGVTTNYNGTTIQAESQLDGGSSGTAVFQAYHPSFGTTTGTTATIKAAGSFAPTSGVSQQHSYMSVETINQTGGANGNTSAFFDNNTITAAANYASFRSNLAAGTNLYTLYNANTAPILIAGKTNTQALVLPDFPTANALQGEIQNHNDPQQAISDGNGTNRLLFLPNAAQGLAIDYNTPWTLGRTKFFFTVPVKYAGYRITKVYATVSAVGTGSVMAVEKNGVTVVSQTITAADHAINVNTVLVNADLWTFNVTTAGTAKGLRIEIELARN